LENYPDLEAITALIEVTTKPTIQHLVIDALKPELTRQVSSRSFVTMESFDRGVHISVRGTDLSSFRASVNSIMRLLNVVFGVLKSVSNAKDGE